MLRKFKCDVEEIHYSRREVEVNIPAKATRKQVIAAVTEAVYSGRGDELKLRYRSSNGIVEGSIEELKPI